jgi:hypothetical protein
MMGFGPYRPLRDLERALERGQLKIAVAAAKDVSHERGRPIGLDLALRFLPLVAAQQLDAYDGWACRWLARWLNETPGVRPSKPQRSQRRLQTCRASLRRSRRCKGHSRDDCVSDLTRLVLDESVRRLVDVP